MKVSERFLYELNGREKEVEVHARSLPVGPWACRHPSVPFLLRLTCARDRVLPASLKYLSRDAATATKAYPTTLDILSC